MEKTIHNTETNEIFTVELTQDEIADLQQIQIEHTMRKEAEKEKMEAKAALLDRLGITAEEAALLLS